MTNMKRQPRGMSLMELVVVFGLALLGLALVVPRARSNEATLSTKATAEELVSRLRRARQTAITKGVPVALAIPTSAARPYSDTAFQLEGELNPKHTLVWKIQQKHYETVLFAGEWPGLAWAEAQPLLSASKEFDPGRWWDGAPPEAALFIFTPSGNAVSNQNAGDGKFRIVVAQGVASSGRTLVQAKSPWTVSISSSGECNLEQGVTNGASVLSSISSSTLQGAEYTPPTESGNSAPVVVGEPEAIPDANNPIRPGKQIDLEKVLNLKVEVTDADGDPPYFEWRCKSARRRTGASTYDNLTPLEEWGGRFSSKGPNRMEWDPETRRWVGRITWTPAPGDKGGNGYQLECEITDRKGGQAFTGFPVRPGHWLETIEQDWILYRTTNRSSNRVEVWKMSVRGDEHQRLIGFTDRDVIYSSWSASGDEIVFATPEGIYRANRDGANVRRLTNNALGGLDGIAMSPRGEYIYYTGGGRENKRLYRVNIVGDTPVSELCRDFGDTDWIYGLTMYERPTGEILAVMGYYRKYTTTLGLNTRHRHGLFVSDARPGFSGDSGNGNNDQPWKSAQYRDKTYGPTFYRTADGQDRAMWGSDSGAIMRYNVSMAGGTHFGITLTADPRGNVNTGVGGYVTSPRPGPDGKSMICSGGGGLVYVKDMDDASSERRILSPSVDTTGAYDGMISRPF